MSEPRIESLPPREATRFAETHAAKTCSLIVFALVMLYTFLVLRGLFHAPQFENMFMEMDTSLPALTRFVLTVIPTVGPLVFLAAIGTIVKEFAVKNRNITLVINGIHLVMLVAMKELIIFALGMPLLRLMNSLG